MAELTDRGDRIDQIQGELLKINKKFVEEFRELLGTPPDVDNIPERFWERVQQENETQLSALLLLVFIAAYDGHRTWGDIEPPKDDTRRDKVATRYITSRSADVAKQFVSRSKDMLSVAGRDWEIKIRSGDPIPKGDIDEVIRKLWGEQRFYAIARTETAVSMVQGGDAGIIHAAKPVTRFWSHSGYRPRGHCNAKKDPCELCSPLEGLPERLCQGQVPGLIHDNCDCFWTYMDDDGFVVGTDVPGLRPGNTDNINWKYRP